MLYLLQDRASDLWDHLGRTLEMILLIKVFFVKESLNQFIPKLDKHNEIFDFIPLRHTDEAKYPNQFAMIK